MTKVTATGASKGGESFHTEHQHTILHYAYSAHKTTEHETQDSSPGQWPLPPCGGGATVTATATITATATATVTCRVE